MPDEEPSPPPPPPTAGPEPGPKSTSTGLPSNVAAAIACVPLIGGIIFYIWEKHDSFVRFYAMQSIIFGFAWILVSIACAIVAGVFGDQGPLANGFFRGFWYLVTKLIDLALFVVFVVTVAKAFTNVRWEIPYIGPIARKQMEGAS